MKNHGESPPPLKQAAGSHPLAFRGAGAARAPEQPGGLLLRSRAAQWARRLLKPWEFPLDWG